MDFYNKKVVLVVYASLAALLLFTFQNCSANLITAVTATPVAACEKEVHAAVDNQIRVSDDEIEVTKDQITEPPKPFFRQNAFEDEAKFGAKRTPRAFKKYSAKKNSKSIANKSTKNSAKKVTVKTKKPSRESASDGDMKIRLKKIKPKKSAKLTES